MPLAIPLSVENRHYSRQPQAVGGQMAFLSYLGMMRDYGDLIQDRTHKISYKYYPPRQESAQGDLLAYAVAENWQFSRAVKVEPNFSEAYRQDWMRLFADEALRLDHFEQNVFEITDDIVTMPSRPLKDAPSIITTMQIVMEGSVTKDNPEKKTGFSFDFLSRARQDYLKIRPVMPDGFIDKLDKAAVKDIYPAQFLALYSPKKEALSTAPGKKGAAFLENAWEIWSINPYSMTRLGKTKRLHDAVETLVVLEELLLHPYMREDFRLEQIQAVNSLHYSHLTDQKISAVDRRLGME